MLRSWRERLLIGLAPSELTLVRVKALLRPRVVGKRAVTCDPAFGSEPWHGAISVFQDEASHFRTDALDVTVVLSNHFVRYALVPWNEALSGAAEELAFARHCFAKIHGERSKAWTVSVSEEPAGAPRLASAIDTALLDTIRACFPSEAKARLVSVQPALMAAVNFWHRPLAEAGAWLLIAEPERACVVLHSEGRWQTVLNPRGSYGTPEEWAELLERERLRTLGADSVTKVLVHSVDSHTERSSQEGAWQLEPLSLPPLEGYSQSEDRRYDMALAAGLA